MDESTEYDDIATDPVEPARSPAGADYQARREARAERMRDRAAKLRGEAAGRLDRSRKLGEVMNGQPILVGHYSERRHRRTLDKMHASDGKAFEAMREADTLDRRADAAEKNRAISSDDPDALDKLRARLAEQEAIHAREVAGNKAIRKALRGADAPEHCTPDARGAFVASEKGRACIARALEGLRALGFTPGDAARALSCSIPRVGPFCGFFVANALATVKATRARIIVLEREEAAAASGPKAPERFGAVELTEADNRVRLTFPGKPSEEARALLKSRGFRWSPTAGAWQRQATLAARLEARELARAISAKGGAQTRTAGDCSCGGPLVDDSHGDVTFSRCERCGAQQL